MSTDDSNDDALALLEQVRSIQLGAGSLYSAMHQAFTLPEGSDERAIALLALDVQIRDYLSLPNNSPLTAMLALGRIATEVSVSLGGKFGLDAARLADQFEQHLIAAQFKNG